MQELAQYVESLIFASENPLTPQEMAQYLSEYLQTSVVEEEIQSLIQHLIAKYEQEEFSFGLRKINGGYVFMTKGAYHELNGLVLKSMNRKKLTKTLMETISIIAYKQPVSKGEIESIRGVSSDYAIQKLLDKELIDISGRSEELGKPLLYKTSEKFMNHFGLNSIDDLPALKELQLEDTGEQAPRQNPQQEEE